MDENEEITPGMEEQADTDAEETPEEAPVAPAGEGDDEEEDEDEEDEEEQS